jgi:uncharacterized protein
MVRNEEARSSQFALQSNLKAPPNHAFNRTRRYGPSFWRTPVAARRLTWSSSFGPSKDAANRRKHGVSLAEEDGVLDDPLALTIEDASAQGEQRFISIGMNVFGQLRVVLYALRGDDARIISVRKAMKQSLHRPI